MQTPYLLIPLGLLCVLLYLLSDALVRLGVWKKTVHRKLWNVVLLITFLVTAVLGLLLVIQINYKLEWEIVDKLLKWHVDVGIALSFVATFHLIWHFSYYLNMFKNKTQSEKQEITDSKQPGIEKSHLRMLIILSGFIAPVIQVLMMREITTVFEGNEFMMGWTLGIWMMLTGTGAFLGRNIKMRSINRILISNSITIVTVLSLLLMILLVLFKSTVFPPGILISPLKFLIACLLILSPPCLLTGIIFSMFVRIQLSEQKGFISVYALEALGSIAGGIAVSFLLIRWLTIFQSLSLLLLVVSTILFAWHRDKILLLPLCTSIILTALFAFTSLEYAIRSRLFPNQHMLESKETLYGNITVTENAGEYNFFSNGSLIFSSENFILREEYAHYALLQRPDVKKVLIISGGISGIASEVLKYPEVETVDCIELNPDLIRLGERYKLLAEDNRIHFIYADGKRFIQNAVSKYDAVIMAVPDPSSLQVNRYYTDEFLTDLKLRLNDKAIVMYGISSTGNYLSNVQAAKLTVLINTLKKHFLRVEIIPGEKDYLLASDSSLSLDITSLYSTAGIENSWVNNDYIDDASIVMRNDFIKQGLPENGDINTNDRSIPVYYDSLRFLSLFYSGRKNVTYLPLLLLLLPLFFMKPESSGMYVAGFSGASVEIILIFAFQVIYGYVYSAIGVIVAAFMAGLTLGSLLGYKWKIKSIHSPALQVVLMLFLIALPLLLKLFSRLDSTWILWSFYMLATLIPALLIGFFFVVSSVLHSSDAGKAVPVIYASDLLGSSLGIIVTTILLVPLLGISRVCYLLAILNLVSMLYYAIRRRILF